MNPNNTPADRGDDQRRRRRQRFTAVDLAGRRADLDPTVFATGTGAGGDGRPAACCDPTLSWDNFGNLFVGYSSGQPPTTRSIELYVTTDLGANFTNLGPVDNGTAAGGTLDQPTVVAA